MIIIIYFIIIVIISVIIIIIIIINSIIAIISIIIPLRSMRKTCGLGAISWLHPRLGTAWLMLLGEERLRMR